MNWVKVTPSKKPPVGEINTQYVNLDQVQRIEPAPPGRGTILWFDENHKLIVQETPAQLGLPVQQQRIQE